VLQFAIMARFLQWLNGLGSPFGIETGIYAYYSIKTSPWLNGLWSPFGIETLFLASDNW